MRDNGVDMWIYVMRSWTPGEPDAKAVQSQHAALVLDGSDPTCHFPD